MIGRRGQAVGDEMRATPFLLVCATLGASGCGVECGSPSQVNNLYAVFANVLEIESVDNEESFPSYASPANGWSEWNLRWDEIIQADVIVEIDSQSFPATGEWNDIECGNFNLDIAGDYFADGGSVHSFTARGQFIQFANQLEGLWDYEEVWTAEDGEQGTFVISGQVNGTVINPGGGPAAPEGS